MQRSCARSPPRLLRQLCVPPAPPPPPDTISFGRDVAVVTFAVSSSTRGCAQIKTFAAFRICTSVTKFLFLTQGMAQMPPSLLQSGASPATDEWRHNACHRVAPRKPCYGNCSQYSSLSVSLSVSVCLCLSLSVSLCLSLARSLAFSPPPLSPAQRRRQGRPQKQQSRRQRGARRRVQLIFVPWRCAQRSQFVRLLPSLTGVHHQRYMMYISYRLPSVTC